MMVCDIASASPRVVARMVSYLGVVTDHDRVVTIPLDVVGTAPYTELTDLTAEHGDQAQSCRKARTISSPEKTDEHPRFAGEDLSKSLSAKRRG